MKSASYGADDPTGGDAKEYFDREDRIFNDPTHPGYSMPTLLPGESVLNVGCGSMKLRPPGRELYVGIDPFFEPLRARKVRDPNDLTIRAIGERLPVADEAFDVVMSRVAMMYMDVSSFLAESYRVLEPGGRLWLTGHTFTHVGLHFARSVRRGNVKDVIFRCYVIFNGLLFHWTGRMIRFPSRPSRIESFQTRGGVRRSLARAGFTNIEFAVGRSQRRGFVRGVRRVRRLMGSERLRRSAGRILGWRNLLITARRPLAE